MHLNSDKRILITGGSGFIGSYCLALAPSQFKTITTYHKAKPLSAEWIQIDLNNPRSVIKVLQTTKPDVVIHTAAVSKPDLCESMPEKLLFQINSNRTKVIAQTCQAIHARLIYLSTDMVFDGNRGHYSEKDTPNPIHRYGKSKLLAEKFVSDLCKNHVIARVALTYGRPDNYGSSFSETVLSHLNNQKSLTLFIDEFRSPIEVSNLAHCLLELAESSWTGIIHLGGPERINRLSFATTLSDIVGIPGNYFKPITSDSIVTLTSRPKDISLDISLAQTILKSPILNISEGLSSAYGNLKQ